MPATVFQIWIAVLLALPCVVLLVTLVRFRSPFRKIPDRVRVRDLEQHAHRTRLFGTLVARHGCVYGIRAHVPAVIVQVDVWQRQAHSTQAPVHIHRTVRGAQCEIRDGGASIALGGVLESLVLDAATWKSHSLVREIPNEVFQTLGLDRTSFHESDVLHFREVTVRSGTTVDAWVVPEETPTAHEGLYRVPVKTRTWVLAALRDLTPPVPVRKHTVVGLLAAALMFAIAFFALGTALWMSG